MKRLFVVIAGLLLSAAFAAPRYFIQADVVRGHLAPQGAVCVPNTVFHPGEMIVWRTYVYDATTGERLTQEQIDARGITVTGKLGDQVEVPLQHIPHPPTDSPKKEVYWAAGWPIPADFPTGMYDWTVVVKDNQGNSVRFTPIGQGIGLGSLTITTEQGAPQPGNAP